MEVSEKQTKLLGIRLNNDVTNEQANVRFQQDIKQYQADMFASCVPKCIQDYRTVTLQDTEKKCLNNCFVAYTMGQSAYYTQMAGTLAQY